MYSIRPLIWVLAGIILTGCEFPGKPDFTTSQKVEAPIMYNKTFQFMGGSTALIDTTSSDLDSLFSVDENDFILITKEQDFDFGDLDDAIPQVNVNPAVFDAQVGEISLNNFSSGSNENLGTADFEELTGLPSATISAGDHIFGGNTLIPVNIQIGANTDYFVSAIVKSGALEISVTNNLGFHIDAIDVVLKSGSVEVGNVTLIDVTNGDTTSDEIEFDEGDALEDLNVDVSVSWPEQSMQSSPGDLIIENVLGVDLIASQVEAVLSSQDFISNSVTIFDDNEFKFTENNHFVELESGVLHINSIKNNIDVTVEELVISFPGIRKSPYTEADSLVIAYDAIPRKGSSAEKDIDLSGYRIYAKGNEIIYNIFSVTEDAQNGTGAEPRVVREDETVSSSVLISDLAVKDAFGMIVPQNVILGDDDYSNGEEILDLYNDVEAELTEIDGLDEFSDQFDGLEFTQPTLSINYTTSVGVGTTVYGAFLGVDGDGDEVYLKGIPGSEFEVHPTDPIAGLYANGVQLSSDQLVKFELETSSDKSLVSGTIDFTTSNTNIDEFLNNLPSQIRFVGKAVINQGNIEGEINTPVQFDPKISIGLPMAFKTTEAAHFTDTTEVSFNLPSAEKGDKATITEGKIMIDYINGLPLGVDMKLNFLDKDKNTFLTLPAEGETMILNSSDVDELTRFATNPTESSIILSLTKQQLGLLNNTEFLNISADLTSTNLEEVKLRTTDLINLTISAELKIEANSEDLFE